MHTENTYWPQHGDRRTFHRTRAQLAAAVAAGAAIGIGATFLLVPTSVPTALPIAIAALLLGAVWAHAQAEGRARRAEVVRSFAGMTVVHMGTVLRIDAAPLVGEFDTRRTAARAAMRHGTWAVLVHAWDRWYVLEGRRELRGAAAPVSFRSRAVSDVVPAIRDSA